MQTSLNNSPASFMKLYVVLFRGSFRIFDTSVLLVDFNSLFNDWLCFTTSLRSYVKKIN